MSHQIGHLQKLSNHKQVTLILKSYISHQFHKWKSNHVSHDVFAVFPTVPAVHQPEFCKAGCIWTASMPFHNRFAKERWKPIIIYTICVLKQPIKTISESMSMCIYYIIYTWPDVIFTNMCSFMNCCKWLIMVQMKTTYTECSKTLSSTEEWGTSSAIATRLLPLKERKDCKLIWTLVEGCVCYSVYSANILLIPLHEACGIHNPCMTHAVLFVTMLCWIFVPHLVRFQSLTSTYLHSAIKASSAFSKPILSMLLGSTSNVSATSWSTSSRIDADGAPRVVTGRVSASKTLTNSLKMGKSVMGRCAVTTLRRMLCVKGKETNWACNSFRAGCHSKASKESLLACPSSKYLLEASAASATDDVSICAGGREDTCVGSIKLKTRHQKWYEESNCQGGWAHVQQDRKTNRCQRKQK